MRFIVRPFNGYTVVEGGMRTFYREVCACVCKSGGSLSGVPPAFCGFDFNILTALKGWVGHAPQGRGALLIIILTLLAAWCPSYYYLTAAYIIFIVKIIKP